MTDEYCLYYADILTQVKLQNLLEEQFFKEGKKSIVGGYLVTGDFQLLAFIRYGPKGGIDSTIVIKNSSITPLTDTVKYGDSCGAFDPKIKLNLKNQTNRKGACVSYMANFLSAFKADEASFDRMFNSSSFGERGPYIQFVGGGAPGLKK